MLISFTPRPASPGQMAIAMPDSVLSALARTGNRRLEKVAHVYDKAALAENTDEMIAALDDGVSVCHRLGLRTAAST